MKKILLPFIFLIGILNVTAQDSIYLIPPTNLQGSNPTQTDYAHLSWNTPYDSVTGDVPDGLLGYNIYRNGELVGSIDYPATEYFDLNLELLTYTYLVSAVYDLSSYGFPGETGESSFAGPVVVILCCLPELPFIEDFTTGVLETNQWTPDGLNGDCNWQIAGQIGNPPPGVEFNNNIPRNNYSRSLTSTWFNATGLIDGRILLDFDLRKFIITQTQTEFLFVDVFNGTEWIQVKECTNDISSEWEANSIDITDIVMGTQFRIRFRAQGESTANILSWNIDNIRIYRTCAPTFDVYASSLFSKPCIVRCEWQSPEPYWNEEWLQWDNGENSDAVGTLSGSLFTVASRFTPQQLIYYAGASLTRIKFFPYDSAEFVLKVWTGDSANQLMLSQPVQSYTTGEWNEFILDSAIYISGTTEFWFGYSADAEGGLYPAGVDSGPSVRNHGNMLLSGPSWINLEQIGFHNNWNLAGYVEFPDKNPRNITHYDVFRNDEYIGSTPNQFYIDTLTGSAGTYCYKVQTIYSDCVSDFSNTYCYELDINCNVGVDDHTLSQPQIYPNPASSLVSIVVNHSITEFIVYNMHGQEITSGLISDGTSTIDVSRFTDGIYYIKFISNDGAICGSKLVVRQK